jgi:hypothetical protein
MPKATATSFGDPRDVVRYNNAMGQGKTEEEAVKVGCRGRGEWGANTTRNDIPMCALPQQEWMKKWSSGFLAAGKPVAVTYKGKTVVGLLADTIPSDPKKGSQIGLNPAFAKALGLTAPFQVPVTWNWSSLSLKQLASLL